MPQNNIKYFSQIVSLFSMHRHKVSYMTHEESFTGNVTSFHEHEKNLLAGELAYS